MAGFLTVVPGFKTADSVQSAATLHKMGYNPAAFCFDHFVWTIKKCCCLTAYVWCLIAVVARFLLWVTVAFWITYLHRDDRVLLTKDWAFWKEALKKESDSE